MRPSRRLRAATPARSCGGRSQFGQTGQVRAGRCCPRASRGGGRDAGLVTIELAFGLVAFALLLLLTLTAIATGVDHLRCAEASRVGARLAARSEPAQSVIAGARASAPEGSQIRLDSVGAYVVVTVRAPERGIFAQLGWDVAAVGRSVAPKEVR